MTDPSYPKPGTYRRRPTNIEAIQWDGTPETAERLRRWCGKHPKEESAPVFIDQMDGEGHATLYVAANSAYLTIPAGEWVAEDDHGFYPIKAEQFAKTYDLVLTPALGQFTGLGVWLDDNDARVSKKDTRPLLVVCSTDPRAEAAVLAGGPYETIYYSPRAQHGRYIEAIAEAAESRRAT